MGQMQTHSPKEITQLLVAWGEGDASALEQLTPLVYEELHRLARHYMRNERPGHTLQSSALVNEAYIRLIDWKNVHWKNRAHFYGVSARLMRQILVDFARSRDYLKRGGGAQFVPVDDAKLMLADKGSEIVALDEALDTLAKLDARQSKIVELRFFLGLSVEETAQTLGVSEGTVRRDWSLARAWLHREMSKSVTNQA